MQEHMLSRRHALRALSAVAAARRARLGRDRARRRTMRMPRRSLPAPITYTLLGAADAADVEALTSQIIPSDDTPGAREAGVTFFIDRALGSFFAHWRPGFMRGLREFQAAVRAAHPQAASFAALSSEQQIEFLHTRRHDAVLRTGAAAHRVRDVLQSVVRRQSRRLGWKLLGFEDQHIFEPPFGYYDRDYDDRAP